jgi:UMF1 family MFS transporter
VNQRRVIAAWCLYDWGNSAFTTLVVTFIYATYFTQAIAPDELTGTGQWARAVGISAVLIALLSPVLGVAADKTGRRKAFLAATTVMSVIATVVLAYIAPSTPNAVFWSLTAFVIANVGFELGIVFYNSFLPIIASPERLGRISGLGWGVGYMGGLACMAIALIAFVQPSTPWFGLSTVEGFHIRATNLLVAAWFGVFSLPLFFLVHEPAVPKTAFRMTDGFAELAQTIRKARRFREVVKFLIAHLIYNDGLVTVWAFGSIYASGTFDMSLQEVMIFGIALNVVSGAGAIAFGFVDDRIGGKKTIMVTLMALSLATVLTVWAPSKTWLWIGGILIGIFGGPNQAASRSLMARFVPPQHQTEFFGLFQLSGKVTSFLGPMLLGYVTVAAGSQRAGVATILIFLITGAAVLATVDEKRGIAAGGSAHVAM